MKSVKLDYVEIGSVCLVDKEEFDRFWSELHKLGIAVKTKRPTKVAAGRRVGSAKKSKFTRKAGSI